MKVRIWPPAQHHAFVFPFLAMDVQAVESCAARIDDSVEKLRYLRQAAQPRVKRQKKSERALQILRSRWHLAAAAVATVVLVSAPAKPKTALIPIAALQPAPAPNPVFAVENRAGGELYSNGLEIRSGYEAVGAPRAYSRYDRATLEPSERVSKPAGIVFHTTESLVAPIEPGNRNLLSHNRADVLTHVRRDRLYNFMIDRFGQVFRIVPEHQTAFHAGHSIWADRNSVYIDLNESFLGVAFEMNAGESATAAQIQSGKLLTEMLRSQFGILDENCVTHAQVSVNPDNLRIGYHTDWGARFPFEAIGLAAGYKSSVAAVEIFGFGYDEYFLQALGNKPWQGLVAAEQQILIGAAARGALSSTYRTALQQHFRELRRHRHDKS